MQLKSIANMQQGSCRQATLLKVCDFKCNWIEVRAGLGVKFHSQVQLLVTTINNLL